MTRVIRGLESMVYEEGLKEFGLFSLGENRPGDRHGSSLSICKSLLQKDWNYLLTIGRFGNNWNAFHDFVNEIFKQWSTQMKKLMHSQLMFFSYQVNQTLMYCMLDLLSEQGKY